jgi:nicotinic acid phosphoribosyltransferase
MASTTSKAQTRAAARKIEAALRKGWRPGDGPVCSFGTRRAQRQGGVS